MPAELTANSKQIMTVDQFGSLLFDDVKLQITFSSSASIQSSPIELLPTILFFSAAAHTGSIDWLRDYWFNYCSAYRQQVTSLNDVVECQYNNRGDILGKRQDEVREEN